MSIYIKASNPGLFIHIPKTAGKSILSNIKAKFQTETIKNARTLNDNYHSTIEDAKNQLGNLDNIFTFTVVRNPWSRILSWYFFRKRILEKSHKEWKHFGSARKVSYENINELILELEKMQQGLYDWLYFYKNRPWDFTWFSPETNQYEWIQEYKIDKIIRFETLNTEIKQIPFLENSILEKTNVSNNSNINYKTFYDDKSKKLVSTMYEKDIDVFKYSF